MSKNNTKDISSQYFKTFMRFRKQTIVEIAEHTGISKRTIQGYAQGNPPFRKASATNFLAITDYMEIEPHYMLGSDKWKLSEYLENICTQNNLDSLRDIVRLPETVRLTKATRVYRAEKKSLRKLRKIKIKNPELTGNGASMGTLCDMYDPKRYAVLEICKKSHKFSEARMHEMEARMRAYIEAFKKIENGVDNEDFIAWPL